MLRLRLEIALPARYGQGEGLRADAFFDTYVDWTAEGGWALNGIQNSSRGDADLRLIATRPDGDLAEALIDVSQLLLRPPLGIIMQVAVGRWSYSPQILRESAYDAFPTPRRNCDFCGFSVPPHARGCPYGPR